MLVLKVMAKFGNIVVSLLFIVAPFLASSRKIKIRGECLNCWQNKREILIFNYNFQNVQQTLLKMMENVTALHQSMRHGHKQLDTVVKLVIPTIC